jgi:hypothetical protein
MRGRDISFQYFRKDGKVIFICLYNFVVTLDDPGYSIELDPPVVRDSSLNAKNLISYLGKPDKKITRIEVSSERLDKFRREIFAGNISNAQQEAYEYVYKVRKDLAFRRRKDS